jgi:hypothetical protein
MLVRKLVIIPILFLLLSSVIIVAHAQAGQIGILPSDDTYVNSSNPNQNYGEQTSLIIENYQSYTQTYESIVWLKFDLSSVPKGAVVDNATLHLYGSVSVPVETLYDVHAYSCSNDSWNEGTLAYSNMLSYNTTSMDSVLVTGTIQWYNWSVVEAVRDALNSNASYVTIVLFDPSSYTSASIVSFNSKETPVVLQDTRPALTIHWSSIVPEFPTFLVLPFFVMTTLLAVTVYRRKHAKISEGP